MVIPFLDRSVDCERRHSGTQFWRRSRRVWWLCVSIDLQSSHVLFHAPWLSGYGYIRHVRSRYCRARIGSVDGPRRSICGTRKQIILVAWGKSSASSAPMGFATTWPIWTRCFRSENWFRRSSWTAPGNPGRTGAGACHGTSGSLRHVRTLMVGQV